MSAPDRGCCPLDDKSRFTYVEACDKVRRAKMRGKAMTAYRCPACGGWWHLAHATIEDGHGGGVRREKQRKPSRAQNRAKQLAKQRR